MEPWAHYQPIVSRWTLCFNSLVSAPCAKAIFCIKEASNNQSCWLYIAYKISYVSRFPPRIIIWMAHKVIPKNNAISHVAFGKVTNCAGSKIEIVIVFGKIVEV